MRMFDPNGGEVVSQLQLYLSPSEAKKLASELETLIRDPEANEHCHLFSEDGSDELSVSIVTEAKLARGGYTAQERKAFSRWKPRP